MREGEVKERGGENNRGEERRVGGRRGELVGGEGR